MDTIVLLGDFLFQEHEIPASIPFGGMETLSVQKRIGGGKVVDSMGKFENDISWSGLFYNNVTLGLSAIDRAKEVNALRSLGLELPFIFYDLIYLVKIKEFRASFERYYQIPYSITLEVIKDLSIPDSIGGAVSFLTSMLNDLNLVQAGAGILNDSALSGLIDKFSSGLNGAGKIENASKSVINSLINSSNAVTSRIDTLIGQYKNNI